MLLFKWQETFKRPIMAHFTQLYINTFTPTWSQNRLYPNLNVVCTFLLTIISLLLIVGPHQFVLANDKNFPF